MKSVAERIMECAEASPEATPICPNALLHLGKRGAVDLALSRSGPLGGTPADLPGRLHAPRRDTFRALCTKRRQVAPFTFETLGRDHRSERRRRGQLAWPDEPEPGSLGLPHFRPRSATALRQAPRGAAPRAALAAGGPAQHGGSGHPRPGMARPACGRVQPRLGPAQASPGKTSTSLQPHGP